jgi:hypothetical protein
LPGVYRFGDQKWPNPNLELQRLSLYITGEALDLAERQANRLGYNTAQDYCTDLLLRAIEGEQVNEKVAEVEAERGPLEGLQEIADDPEYLAELSAAAPPRTGADAPRRRTEVPEIVYASEVIEGPVPAGDPGASGAPLSPAAWVVLRHAAQAGGGEDPLAFLPSLRRGEPVSPAEVAELAQALSALEAEYRDARAMDRRLTFALHRLAFESQILHTDAWPNAFDAWTVDTLRAVQESVERILSGQDIRYFGDPAGPQGPADGRTPSIEDGPAPRPETPR